MAAHRYEAWSQLQDDLATGFNMNCSTVLVQRKDRQLYTLYIESMHAQLGLPPMATPLLAEELVGGRGGGPPAGLGG